MTNRFHRGISRRSLLGGVAALSTGLALPNLGGSLAFAQDDITLDVCVHANHPFDLPLVVPGLVVVGILQFIAVWNDFLYELLILKTDEMRTVTVALTEMSRRTQAATLYGPLFAGIVLATLPSIILYIVFQSRLTQGILSGALRG